LYKENYDTYKIANSLENSNLGLLLATQDELDQGVVSMSEELFIGSQFLFAKINALKAYGEFKTSLQQLKYAMGIPQPDKEPGECNEL
jgi:hypothetical protein